MHILARVGDAVDARGVGVIARPRVLRQKLRRAGALVRRETRKQRGREVHRQPLVLHRLAEPAAGVRPRVGIGQVGLDVQQRRAALHIHARNVQHRPVARVRLDRLQLHAGQADGIRPVGRPRGEHAHPPVAAQTRRPYRRRPAPVRGRRKQPEQPDMRNRLQPAERFAHAVFRLKHDPPRQRRTGRALAGQTEFCWEVRIDAPDGAEGNGVAAHKSPAFCKPLCRPTSPTA